jgi:hypothetical protein
MATSNESRGQHIRSMWVEAGIQFRSNLFVENTTVDLHVHSFDHVAIVTHGWLAVTEIAPDGERRSYQVASKGFQPHRVDLSFEPIGYRVTIPKGHQHSFALIESQGQPAEVLCLFPAVLDDEHDASLDDVSC